MHSPRLLFSLLVILTFNTHTHPLQTRMLCFLCSETVRRQICDIISFVCANLSSSFFRFVHAVIAYKNVNTISVDHLLVIIGTII